MSLYFVLFTLVFAAAYLSLIFRYSKVLDLYVAAVFVMMTAMVCFRFGQGTDYFSYRAIFYAVSSFDRIVGYTHGEPLYLFLCYIFNLLGGFELFVFCVSLAEMLMIWSFLRRNSANRAVSLLIFISVTYIIYFYNLMRQGLAMSIFMCYGTKYIQCREWNKYIMTCIIATMIHTVSAIYFFVPMVLKFRTGSVIRGGLSIILGIIITPLLAGTVRFVGSYDTRYIAAAERLSSFIVINVVYHSIYKEKGGAWWMKLYCFGTGLYFMFLSSSLVASRLAACFKALEMIIVPELMKHKSRYRVLFIIYFFALSAVMFTHSLLGEAENGGYISRNPLNIPYVSIFNAQDIYNYRVNAPR